MAPLTFGDNDQDQMDARARPDMPDQSGGIRAQKSRRSREKRGDGFSVAPHRLG
jgi:hypothetical protein